MRQIINPGIRLARSQKGSFATQIAPGVYARAITMRPPKEGAVIPDNLWTISDPTSCSISNNVITWTRTTADSFIRLAKPASLSAGQTWVLSYEVLVDSGVGSTDRLFIGADSCVRPAPQVGTSVQKWSYEVVATDTTHLLNWTPTSTFNNQTLQIRDVRVYDKNNPSAYP